MATRFIRRSPSGANQYTGDFSGIGVDSDSDVLEINIDGTKRAIAVQRTAALTAAATLTAKQSGSTFYLDASTEFATTLPAPALGLKFTFIVKTAPSGASYTVITASSANVMKGHVMTSQDAGGTSDSETSGGDTFSFVDGKAVAGDKAIFESDGTSWFVSAFAKVFDGATITTAT